jgi:two-component system CheB/CheR fusion protein
MRGFAPRYLVALASVALATWARLALNPWLGNQLLFITFFIAVMVSACYGGIGPALVTTFLGAASALWFFIPTQAASTGQGIEHFLGLLLYLVAGMVLTLLSASLHRARRRSERSAAQAITRKRQLEQEMLHRTRAEQLNAQLAAMVRWSEDAIIGQTLTGQIVSWNAGAEALFGYKAEEVLGQSMALFLTENATRLSEALDRLQLGYSVAPFEAGGLRKGGSEVRVSVRVSPILDAASQVTGASIIARDITERKRLEDQLHRSEARFRRVFESNMVAMGCWRPDGSITEANGALLRMLGFSREDLQARRINLRDVTPPEYQPLEEKALTACRGAGVCDPFEIEFLRSDRRRVPVLVGAASMLEAGRDAGVFFALDLSERRQAQEKLRETESRYSAQLDHEAQETTRRNDVFLAMLAHELRNPLAPIRNAVQVMRLLSPRDSKLEWSRDVIERQVGHLARLVDDLLDVSRLMRGMVKIQKKQIELSWAVAHAVETSRPLIDEKGHELTVSLPTKPVCLDADLTRLTQVLVNLLNNAAKYTEAGGHIVLRAECAGDQVVIRVCDNGQGISADLLPHVFDLFTQGKRTLARSEGGLGIGLTLVKNLVEMHGGSVSVHSEGAGRGSEFTVRLPALASAPAAEKHEATRKGGAFMAQCQRILVVDDKPDAADSLALLLRVTGHQVRTAYDGPKALEVAREFAPEIVFLDLGMPGMDGYEVARRLRKELGLERALLVALTGYNQEEDVRSCRQAGFDMHLCKPADLDVLRDLLGSRLDQDPADA